MYETVLKNYFILKELNRGDTMIEIKANGEKIYTKLNDTQIQNEPEIQNPMSVIQDDHIKKLITERCGSNPVADGIQCTHCGCYETYKDGNDINNTDKWVFMIRAFRVNNNSECNNCGNWF